MYKDCQHGPELDIREKQRGAARLDCPRVLALLTSLAKCLDDGVEALAGVGRERTGKGSDLLEL